MKSTFFWGIFFLTSICLSGTSQADGDWERIPVDIEPDGYTVTVGDEERLIYPSCALGEPYSFHFKPGKRDKLLVYYNGGGACYDSLTCVASLQLPPPPQQPKPTYVPSADIANNPADMGGILDVNNPNNPYADWSMLFISYCTGDVHVGSTDTIYDNPYPTPLLPDPQVTIHHRGFDNAIYAINWLKDIHPEIAPGKLLVAGSSAGSYGATLNYPTLKGYYSDAKMFGVSDGGMGVIKDAHEFVNAVFGEPSNWNIHDTLHPIFTSLPSAVIAQPENFLPEAYDRLSGEYPKDKFAQYTTAYDAVQIFFWDIMLNPDTPLLWGLGLSDGAFIGRWNFEMNSITGDLRASLLKNYRSYIGPGCNHTILRHDDDFYNSFLTTSTGSEITFLEWLTALTGGDKTNWQNLSCTPGDCGEGNLAGGIQACLERTF